MCCPHKLIENRSKKDEDAKSNYRRIVNDGVRPTVNNEARPGVCRSQRKH